MRNYGTSAASAASLLTTRRRERWHVVLGVAHAYLVQGRPVAYKVSVAPGPSHLTGLASFRWLVAYKLNFPLSFRGSRNTHSRWTMQRKKRKGQGEQTNKQNMSNKIVSILSTRYMIGLAVLLRFREKKNMIGLILIKQK
ncbi:hypothetical protein EJB05_01731, partial [Eragrostis curvula]